MTTKLQIVPAPSIVSLAATPDAGWQFEGWSGAVTSPLTQTQVLMDADKVITATFTQGCVEVTGVTLSKVTAGTIYTNTLVAFSADIAPDTASKPYTCTIDYGHGAPVTTGSSADPLALSHTFTAVGTYTVHIAVWNCAMTEAVTSTVEVVVNAGQAPAGYQLCLPLIAKNN